MRIYPIIPIFFIAPLLIVALALFVLCMAKKKLRVKKNMRRISMLVLMCVILLRPVFIGGRAQSEINNLNLYFVVDATYSMKAKDIGGKARYVKVAKDIYDIVKALPGSKYSVIIEDNAIYTAVPMSTSAEFVSSVWYEELGGNNRDKSLISPKNPDNSIGTDLNMLLNHTGEMVNRYKKKEPGRKNIIFFMSDGEDFGDGISKQETLRKNLDGGAVFGYGSEAGANMEYASSLYERITYRGNNSSVETETCTEAGYGRCVVTRINEDNLKKIATNLNIKYYHRENGEVPSEIINDIKKLEEFTDTSEISNSYIDIYWVFSMILLGLLLWDFREVLDNVMREREFKHA